MRFTLIDSSVKKGVSIDRVLKRHPEMERFVGGQGPIGNYLLQIFKDYHKDHFGWSKVLWDMTAVAWVVSRPGHVNINTLELMSIDQTWGPFAIHRATN